MTLKEYIKQLESLIEGYPDTANMQVVTSADDEGNYFSPVHFGPTTGHYDCGEFDSEGKANAVCVN